MSEPHLDVANLEELLRTKRIIVCMGSGGVGKTTTSAVLGLHAAMLGRKVLVCTVDPAKRLANSLGVAELSDSAREIPATAFDALEHKPSGTLFAMMLDMKHAFDNIIARTAPNPEVRDRILHNRIYRAFSTSLAGTQEYSAFERLYELYEQKDYDLVVFDTAPTTYALDFIEAPRKLFEALDSSVFQWFASRGRTGFGLGLVKLGAGYVIKVLAKFTGQNFIEDFGVFVSSMNMLWDDFKQRADRVRQILASGDVAALVISGPDPVSLEEARYLDGRLREQQLPIGAFVINRVHQRFVPQPVLAADPAELGRRLGQRFDGDIPPRERLDGLAARLLTNAREFHSMADRDADALAALRAAVRNIPVLAVPFFSTDIHTINGLNRMRTELFRSGPALRPEERTLGRL